MVYYGILPERKLWVKIAVILLAGYSILHAFKHNNWFYLPISVILILSAFSQRKQVVSKEGIDIVYTLLGHDFHNLWKWEELFAVHTDRIKSSPNVEFHFSKGVINRRFIFKKDIVAELTAFIEEMRADIKVSEVRHK